MGPRNLIRLSLALLAGAMAALLDTTMLSVALAELGREFGASPSQLQLVSTAYLLAMAVVIPPMGWEVDRWGGKATWMASLAVFLAGSLLCGAAWSVQSLVAFRTVQGVGGGLILPLTQAILADAAGPKAFGRAMSLVAIPGQLAPILGPVLGGAIVSTVGWRWIFYINLPICLVALWLAWRELPAHPARLPRELPAHAHDRQERRDEGRVSRRDGPTGSAGGRDVDSPGARPDPYPASPAFDLAGFLLLSPALAALAYGLSLVGTSGRFLSAGTTPWLAVGGLLAIGFVVVALRKGQASLVDLGLFRHRSYAASASLMFLFGIAIYGPMLLFPLYLQTVHGDGALDAGVTLAPQGAGTMAGILLAGRWSDRAGSRPVVLGAMLITTMATLALARLDAGTDRAFLTGALFVRGLALGAAGIPVMAAAYHGLQSAQIPRATGGIHVVQRLGASFGTALLAVILQRSIPVSDHAEAAAVISAGVQQATEAFRVAFRWVVAFAAIALVPALFLPHNGPAKRHDEPQPRAGDVQRMERVEAPERITGPERTTGPERRK